MLETIILILGGHIVIGILCYCIGYWEGSASAFLRIQEDVAMKVRVFGRRGI
jgi:hypothetical protein